EATTLATAPLIYFYRRPKALEAAWKYLLICSVGIALALLGVFFLGIAASAAPGRPPALTVSGLSAAATAMSRPWLKAAFVLALGGSAVYGTLFQAVNHSVCKAGLFLLAGNVLREFGTTDATAVRGVWRRLPLSGALLMALVLAIGGSPPFGPFWSEFIIFRSAMAGPHAW